MIRMPRGDKIDPRSVQSSRSYDRADAPSRVAGSTDPAPALQIKPLDVPAYIAAAKRRKGLIALTALATTLATLAFAMAMPRSYVSGTRLLIDPRGLQVIDRDVTPRSGTTDQVISVVESEMRVATSDKVLSAVIEKLKLTEDPEFNGSKRYVWSFATDLLDGVRGAVQKVLAREPEPPRPDLVALREMQKAVRIRREPQSFVADINVRTEDAAKSALIADTVAAQYLETRATTQSGATRRASETMTGRLDELRRRLEESEARAQAFRRDNELVIAGGRLVSDQQLSELNTQLGNARGESSRSAVRLEQIQQIRRSGADPDSIAETLQSETIVRLKTQYAAVRRREASLQATLLPSHPMVKQVRQELADSRRQISEEIGRIAEAARLEVERTRNNERALDRQLGELKERATLAAEKMAKVRELELEVESSRSIFNSFMTRGRELGEQQRLDTSLVTVLSFAVPPRNPSGIPLSLLAPAGLMAGLLLGCGLAVWRDRKDPVLRGSDQLALLGAEGDMTIIPAIETGQTQRRVRGRNGMLEPGEMIPSFVTTDPQSEASRAIVRLVDDIATSANRTEGTTLLVTATAAFEGKTTIAVNLALAAARSGDKVLLVDGDLESRTLSEAINASGHPGLSDVIAGKEQLSNVVLHVPSLSVDLLPAGQSTVRLTGHANRLVERAMRDVVAPYDVVVIDGGLLPHGRLLSAWSMIAVETVIVTRAGLSRKSTVADAYDGAKALTNNNLRTVLIAER